MGFREWFWGTSPPEKRIESRGSGWLGNGWSREALLDSRPIGEARLLLRLAQVGKSADSKASWREMKWFLRSLTLRAMPLRWF